MKIKMISMLATTVMLSIGAQAADLYVSVSGNDSSSGTSLAPLRTIQRAAALVKPGTVVHVAPGTYTGNIKTNISGTSSERIRFVSDSKWGAKIVGTGTDFHWQNKGNFVDIVGFDVTGSGRGGILNLASSTLIANNHVHNLKISGGCTGAGGAGIMNGEYSAADGDIIGNVVNDVGVPGSCNAVHGIYHANLRGHIYNNITYRNSSFGIHLWHAADQVIVTNNISFANGSGSMGGGIVFGRGDSGGGIMNNTRIANNIVYNNPAYGIRQYCASGSSCIGSGNTVANNLVYGNGNGNISLRVGSASGTITADPQFVNYKADGSGDYHVKGTSPAIDKGSAQSAPKTDFDGVARPQGAAVDIGAYEYRSAVAPTPTPAPVPAPTPAPSASVSLSSTSLSFSSQRIGTTSPPQIIVLKNTGKVSIQISSAFVLKGEFGYGGTGTCNLGVSYSPGASCTITLVFKPKAAGSRTGSLNVLTSASSAPMTVKLSGIGR